MNRQQFMRLRDGSIIRVQKSLPMSSQVPTDDLLRLQADLQSRGVVYLVWFNTDWWQSYLYDIDDLKDIYDLERIVTRTDGDVYRVSIKGQ